MNWFNEFWKRLNTPIDPGASETRPPAERLANFTPRAQQVLALARREADRFHHNFVGTEHLLLGLIRLGQGTAVTVLNKLGLDLESVRSDVEKQVGTGPDQKMIGNIPYTPRVKKVLALAVKEAAALNHTYIGTEHILLGLLREGDGVAARVLKHFKVDIEQTRQEILNELDPNLRRPSKEVSKAQNPALMNPNPESIDLTKRYDIYCKEGEQTVVYRNALLKGTKTLFQKREYDIFSQFLELEQSDGSTIYIARSSLTKFCEHGTALGSEIV